MVSFFDGMFKGKTLSSSWGNNWGKISVKKKKKSYLKVVSEEFVGDVLENADREGEGPLIVF